ncbi:MerR family transcriptional regulator [Nonomuraea sp. H19]|uniref:MerR family transcriptional regulator n=1 Tax=Nonomuraea sp. H19 TaxID=3452206 RepID=UPI003F8BDBAC
MRIGDLAAASGVKTKTVRFYEQAGLLPAPPRTAGGYRDYPQQTVKRLAFIRDAQGAGLSLAEIRSVFVLRDAGASPCAHVTAPEVVDDLSEAHLPRVIIPHLE